MINKQNYLFKFNFITLKKYLLKLPIKFFPKLNKIRKNLHTFLFLEIIISIILLLGGFLVIYFHN